MKTKFKIMFGVLILVFAHQIGILQGQEKMNYNKLTPEEERIIIHKGTEQPWTGKYNDHKEYGTYTCKRCDVPLYRSDDKFDSHCSWPSFDDEIPGAIKRQLDKDGIRTEIICANCGAHLGHVFEGEGLTPKSIRHCVNSISLNFIPGEDSKSTSLNPKTERAIFASGCFWGTEYYIQSAPGVISTTVGYTGGYKANPTYKEVSRGNTGHKEAVEVIYDPNQTSYEEMAKLFFETHNFEQTNGQGPDIGEQYLSYIFYENEQQKETAEKLIQILNSKDYKVATKLEKAGTFWKAEDYHQDYYNKTGKTLYCHFRRDVF